MSNPASNWPPPGPPVGARAALITAATRWVMEVPRTPSGRPAASRDEWLSDHDGAPTPGFEYLRASRANLSRRMRLLIRA